MYLHTIGGSALLHLLMAYPRLILILGIAGTVAAVNAPHGPGRYVGTEHYLARLDATIAQSSGDQGALEARAARMATTAMELSSPTEIQAAVTYTLHECGSGCTDLSTPIVTSDADLLEGVLTLYYLDQLKSDANAGGGRRVVPSGVQAARR